MVEFLIGIFVGAILYYAFGERKRASGTFVIDFSDPVKDVCKLELDEDINDIYLKKQIILNVKTYGDISQE